MYIELTNLIKYLSSKNLFKSAMEIDDIVNYLLDGDEDEDKEKVDVSSIINGVGLSEDGTINNMNQGFSLEPFFTHYGPVD